MNCNNCHIQICIKRGKRNGIQRYFCKSCNSYFQQSYTYSAYLKTTNTLITSMLKEGCGILSISRIIGVSKNTVLSRMLEIADNVKQTQFNNHGCKFEVDEMWTFVKQKNNFTWITYAIERETRTVIDFFVGNKSKQNIKPLINKVLLLQPKRIYTDRLNIYPSLIPKEVHKRFKYDTNRIERMNLNLRTHIKRLSRKTICFSKKERFLIAHLKIYFWG